MAENANTEFEFIGVNHLAPVCRDMRETVDFYHGLLGMPVTTTTQFGPEGHEQQIFFFDIGGGCHLAFMWAADAIPGAPGVASPAGFLEDTMGRDLTKLTAEEIAALPSTLTAIGSMNHLALNVAPDRIDEYREKLVAKGIDVSEVKYQTMDENCRPVPIADGSSPRVFMKSIYFHDPNGIQLEFACWTRAMTEAEASLSPLGASSESALVSS
jgi:catechol 2,3-dioxygenase-like lactoylglutathione lyase family enzyme